MISGKGEGEGYFTRLVFRHNHSSVEYLYKFWLSAVFVIVFKRTSAWVNLSVQNCDCDFREHTLPKFGWITPSLDPLPYSTLQLEKLGEKGDCPCPPSDYFQCPFPPASHLTKYQWIETLYGNGLFTLCTLWPLKTSPPIF